MIAFSQSTIVVPKLEVYGLTRTLTKKDFIQAELDVEISFPNIKNVSLSGAAGYIQRRDSVTYFGLPWTGNQYFLKIGGRYYLGKKDFNKIGQGFFSEVFLVVFFQDAVEDVFQTEVFETSLGGQIAFGYQHSIGKNGYLSGGLKLGHILDKAPTSVSVAPFINLGLNVIPFSDSNIDESGSEVPRKPKRFIPKLELLSSAGKLADGLSSSAKLEIEYSIQALERWSFLVTGDFSYIKHQSGSTLVSSTMESGWGAGLRRYFSIENWSKGENSSGIYAQGIIYNQRYLTKEPGNPIAPFGRENEWIFFLGSGYQYIFSNGIVLGGNVNGGVVINNPDKAFSQLLRFIPGVFLGFSI